MTSKSQKTKGKGNDQEDRPLVSVRQEDSGTDIERGKDIFDCVLASLYRPTVHHTSDEFLRNEISGVNMNKIESGT